MTWNYRVMRRVENDDDITYGIYEVYYDDKGLVHSWTEHASGILADDDVSNLKLEMKYVEQAFLRPVLDHETGKEIEE